MSVLAVTSWILLVAVDQVTKYIARAFLMDIGGVAIIEGIFHLTYVENTGAAFGLFKGGRWYLIILVVLILTGILIYYIRLPKNGGYKWARFSLVLISAGAVGNLIDRIVNGYVVDFFHASFINFPVFNMADIYVVTGTIMLAVILLFFVDDSEPPVAEAKADE